MNSKPTQPSEIAREVLRQLAMRRQLPTPDHYTALYNEIAGTGAVEVFPDRPLKDVVASLPRKTPEQTRIARQLETAISEKSWGGLKKAVQDIVTANTAEPLAWGTLLRELIQQLERSHAQLTPARKRETLDRLLQAAATPELLHGRLQSLLKSWAQGETAEDIALVDGELPPPETSTSTTVSAAASSATLTAANPTHPASPPLPPPNNNDLQEWFSFLLENSISTLLADAPELNVEVQTLAKELRKLRPPEGVAGFAAKLKKFSYRLQFLAEDQLELRTALLHLLRLIIENISEIVIDDRPLHNQISTLLELVNKPLNLRQLDDIERRMKDVIFKQGMLKKQLTEAQERLREMLASFVDRLADMSIETGAFHETIETCAQRIGQANDISQISEVLGEVMTATRAMQLNAQRSRDELQAMRQRVVETEKELERLQTELSQASEMVRIDPLTGTLNRKGMEEAMDREVARFLRQKTNLCLAMLDIDNFKKLNDTRGHEAGDAALVHLAQVVKDTIRPQDTVARYGGEEFVLLLPETSLEESVAALTRLQRELTRKFFMHNNEKILITFSAGVAEISPDEAPMEALKRADQAMYLAKRAGKNRVVPA